MYHVVESLVALTCSRARKIPFEKCLHFGDCLHYGENSRIEGALENFGVFDKNRYRFWLIFCRNLLEYERKFRRLAPQERKSGNFSHLDRKIQLYKAEKIVFSA